MAKVAKKQVNAEKKRLIEARNIANSEKRLYVKVALCFVCFLLLFFSFVSLFRPSFVTGALSRLALGEKSIFSSLSFAIFSFMVYH